MAREQITQLECPPSSPDLNPIEMVWADLKGTLRNKVKPRTKEELIAGIRDYWCQLTVGRCANFINHMHKALPLVVINHGGPSGM